MCKARRESFMDSLCRGRNEIMYVLSWRTVSALTRVGYFGIYFPRCFATREINTKITFSWALKRFFTRVHTLFSIYYTYPHNYEHKALSRLVNRKKTPHTSVRCLWWVFQTIWGRVVTDWPHLLFHPVERSLNTHNASLMVKSNYKTRLKLIYLMCYNYTIVSTFNSYTFNSGHHVYQYHYSN